MSRRNDALDIFVKFKTNLERIIIGAKRIQNVFFILFGSRYHSRGWSSYDRLPE